MNVLSLFDGMSCARIALKELGIKVDKYFASEIDKYAIAQTRLNFPDTIQLGDVTQVDGYALPKIDLLVGGSPCQGFSFNGVRQLNQSKESAGQQPYQQNRIYDTEGKSPALMHGHAGNTINVFGGGKIRRLTPLECSRLQTIPSWYVWQCSETQTYKMLGNGWTVEVIKHIFSYLKQ